MTDTAIRASADRAFASAGIGREQVGLASLYDCYTSTVLLTLEDAGLCPKGRAAEFVDSHDLTWRGDFPVNTHGGQLSFGQADVAGGMSHVTEAVLQLQRRAEGRQVRDLEFAFVNGNGGIMSEQASVVLVCGMTRPMPYPSPLTEPFWAACRRHELMVQLCEACGALAFYPRSTCP